MLDWWRINFVSEKGDYINVFNLGISGDDTRGILKRLENEIEPRVSNNIIIIFSFGNNDSLFLNKEGRNNVPIEDYKENLRKVFVSKFNIINMTIFFNV